MLTYIMTLYTLYPNLGPISTLNWQGIQDLQRQESVSTTLDGSTQFQPLLQPSPSYIYREYLW